MFTAVIKGAVAWQFSTKTVAMYRPSGDEAECFVLISHDGEHRNARSSAHVAASDDVACLLNGDRISGRRVTRRAINLSNGYYSRPRTIRTSLVPACRVGDHVTGCVSSVGS
jgi:hypothetical protein